MKVFMKSSIKLGIFLFAGLFVAGAGAEPLNFDVGYSKLTFKEDDFPKFTPQHLKFALSRNNFEAIASVNVRSSKETYGGTVTEVTFPYILGLYYKPEISFKAGINAFARAGLTHISYQQRGSNIPSGKHTASGNGFSYGFGMSTLSTSTSKVSLDFTSYYNREGTDVKSISLTHSFIFPY